MRAGWTVESPFEGAAIDEERREGIGFRRQRRSEDAHPHALSVKCGSRPLRLPADLMKRGRGAACQSIRVPYDGTMQA